MTLCTLSSELMEKASERVSSGWTWAGNRAIERVRPRGERLDVDVAVLGVRGTAAGMKAVEVKTAVGGKTAVAGTSSPSLRRRCSSLVRRWAGSDGSEQEEPDAVEGALEMIDGAMESTDPRWWCVVSDGESGGEGGREGDGEALRSGGRWVGLRLPHLQVDSVSAVEG